MRRTQPLVNIDAQLAEAEAEFDQKWEAGEIEGWGEVKKAEESGANEGIWCPACKYFLLLCLTLFSEFHRPKDVF
jgi:splicing factor 3A subunit 3